MSRTLFKRRIERESFCAFPIAMPFVHTELYPVQSPIECVWCGRLNMRYPTDSNLRYCNNDICRSFVLAIELFKLGMMEAELKAITNGWSVNETLNDYMDDMNRSMFLAYERIAERNNK